MKKKRNIALSIMLFFVFLVGSFNPASANNNAQDNENLEVFLLIGIDFPKEFIDGFNQDSEIVGLLSVNWDTGAVRTALFSPQVMENLLSQREKTFSTAYGEGGNQYFVTMVEETYALEIDHAISLDFDGVLSIIDALGGLQIEIIEEDLNQDLINAGTNTTGWQYLNGEQVLAYISNENIGMYKNQQSRLDSVKTAFQMKKDQLNLKTILNITNTVSTNLTMDMNLVEKTKLIQNGLDFQLTDARQIFIFTNTTQTELYNYLYFID